LKLKFIFKKAKGSINLKTYLDTTRLAFPWIIVDLNQIELPGDCYPVSKKCCKSYKEGKACKKCPRFRDWNYLMSWTPVRLDPQNSGRGERLTLSFSCETQLSESRRVIQESLSILEPV
jgi:hypothetical protein